MKSKKKMLAAMMFEGLHSVTYRTLQIGNAVPLKQIVTNPYQPSHVRSTLEKTEDLRASVIESRYLQAIEVAKIPNTPKARAAWRMTLEEYPIRTAAGIPIQYYGHLNGDRRMKTAGRLGLKKVDAAVVELPVVADNPAALIKCFIERQTSMTVDAAQQFTIFGEANTNEERDALLGALTVKVKNSINAFVELMGLDAAITESKKGTTNPAIAQLGTSFETMYKKYGHETAIKKRRLDTITPKDLVVWMIEHGTKRLVDDIKRYYRSNEDIVIGILKAVERNVECKLETRNDGMKFIVDCPKNTATSKKNMPINTKTMGATLNLFDS